MKKNPPMTDKTTDCAHLLIGDADKTMTTTKDKSKKKPSPTFMVLQQRQCHKIKPIESFQQKNVPYPQKCPVRDHSCRVQCNIPPRCIAWSSDTHGLLLTNKKLPPLEGHFLCFCLPADPKSIFIYQCLEHLGSIDLGQLLLNVKRLKKCRKTRNHKIIDGVPFKQLCQQHKCFLKRTQEPVSSNMLAPAGTV